jgi:hypothetical protein
VDQGETIHASLKDAWHAVAGHTGGPVSREPRDGQEFVLAGTRVVLEMASEQVVVRFARWC